MLDGPPAFSLRIDSWSFAHPGCPGRIPDLKGVTKGAGVVRGVRTGGRPGV
jgi:hypothetical protein